MSQPHIHIVCLSLVLLLCPVAAWSDDAGNEASGTVLPEMTVTARSFGTPVTQTPGGIGVLHGQDLEVAHPTGVGDAVARIPGVDMTNDSAWGGDVSIRGLSRESVAMLIDGVRLHSTTDINGRFGTVNIHDIERIEVLKGPISALYGAGSTGGVVNVVTRQGHFADDVDWGMRTVLGAQSNPAGPDTWAEARVDGPQAWLRGSAGWREHDSYYDGDGDRVRNSQYADRTARLAGALKWADMHITSFQYQHYDAWNVGIPGSGTAGLPENADVTLETDERRMLALRHAFTPQDSALRESRLDLAYQLMERNPVVDEFTSGQVEWIRPWAAHETVSAKWLNTLDLGAHTLTAGAEVWKWAKTGDRTRMHKVRRQMVDKPSPDAEQLSSGLFAEDDIRLSEAWKLNVGARYDKVTIDNDRTATVEPGSRDNETTGGHLGLTWSLAEHWSMTGLAATSHRSPNLMELFKNINLGGGQTEIGDPDLDPERSVFLEYGLHYAAPTLRGSLSAFRNALEDMITARQVDAATRRISNVGRAEILGLEAEAQWSFLSGWSLFADAAYAQGRDLTDADHLSGVAPLNGDAGLRQDLECGLWWSADVRWAARQDKVPEGEDETPGWTTINLRSGYGFQAWDTRHEITLGVDNLLDREYHNHLATSRGLDLNQPGLNAFVAWSVEY